MAADGRASAWWYDGFVRAEAEDALQRCFHSAGTKMKRCTRCAEKIQNGATVCRFCGTPQSAQQGSNSTLILVCLGIVVLIAWGNSMKEGSKPSPPEPTVEKAREEETRPNAIQVRIMALRKLEGMLREPESMETRNLAVPPGSAYLCGEVNSRNGFGGMTGYRRFMAGAASAMPAVIEGEGMMAPEEFETAWERLCS